LRPLRVAVRKEDVYAEARNMVADLDGWKLVEADERALVLRCERKGGPLSAPARVTISVEGPDGIPSATVNVESQSAGGLFSRDKANVAEFLEPFGRRVG
jgi:hypothetical protein